MLMSLVTTRTSPPQSRTASQRPERHKKAASTRKLPGFGHRSCQLQLLMVRS